MKRFQFVWWGWGRWHAPSFRRLSADHSLAFLYRWFLWIGPLEIRCWTDWAIDQRSEKS